MIIGISGKAGSGKDTIAYIIQYLITKYKSGGFPNLEYGDYSFYFASYVGDIDTNIEIESKYKIVKFADKLKDIVCSLLNCTREQLEDREFKEKALGEEWWCYEDRDYKLYPYDSYDGYVGDKELVVMTPRLLLQLLGTNCGRQIIHPNIWVNATMADYEKSSNWIISDVRFPNEAKVIKDKNGILIRVNRNPIGMLNKVNYTYSMQGTLKYVNNELKLIPHESETALDDYKNWDYIIDNDGSIPDLVEKVKDILIKEKLI